MIKGSLAKRYARALLALGQEQGVAERLGEELDRLAHLAATDDNLRLVMKTPIVARELREKILVQICQALNCHDLIVRFLKLLNEKGRLAYLEQIAAAFRELMDEALGRVRAEVITATPLSPPAESRVQAALGKLTGKEVIMALSVDESLIAGVVARVGGMLLDGSVQTQLRSIQERLRTAGDF